MLNHVLNLIQYWFSISFCPKGEILKRVQDDKSVKFQICLVRFKISDFFNLQYKIKRFTFRTPHSAIRNRRFRTPNSKLIAPSPPPSPPRREGRGELTMNQFLIKYIVWVTNEGRMEGATYGRPDINR